VIIVLSSIVFIVTSITKQMILGLFFDKVISSVGKSCLMAEAVWCW